jgi:hypothetical protein
MMIFVLGWQVDETRNPRFEGNQACSGGKELVLKIGLLCSYPANS